jgi:TPR repeat protein
VGVAYQQGADGQLKSPQIACEYYLKSAEGGYMQSQYNLAMLYSTPEVLPPNYVQAYKWLLISQETANGCRNLSPCDWVLKDPENQGTNIKSHMTQEQIAEARRLAASWMGKR